MTYTVQSVAPNPRQWGDPPNGLFLDYAVTFAEHADRPVSWSRKVSSTAPEVGQQVDGTIDWDAKFGPKFKQEYAGRGSSTSTGGSTWKPRDPSETAAIQRQHCQKVAVQVAASAGWFGNGFDPGDAAGQAKLNLVSRLATWFQRDIAKGVEVAQQDATAKQSYGQVREPERTGVSDVPSDNAPAHAPLANASDLPF